jgi:hypothetical protein
MVDLCMSIYALYRTGSSLNVRWNAQFHEGSPDSLVDLAALKLTNTEKFNTENMNHVLAVLSHRLCIDPLMTSSEATKLADRSIADHMRILTGFSCEGKNFHTSCPSEPLLTLGAVDLLHNEKDSGFLGRVLNTLTDKLCKDGLIEKGLMGELASRTLLLLARDMAAPTKPNGVGRDLLKPVLLMNFLDVLFGNETWCHSKPKRDNFTDTFESTYVNFTHWALTRDGLPETPSK